MNFDALGLIFTGGNDGRMPALTRLRSIAALPVGSRYRMIDFIVSNLVNSGIRNVGVITQKNYQSLMDHLGSGKEWDLNTKRDGLFILPPYLTREYTDLNGNGPVDLLDALRSNLAYLQRAKQKYIILCNSDRIFNCTFDDVLEQHIETGADITVMYTKAPPIEYDPEGVEHVYLELDKSERITDLEISPRRPNHINLSMEVFVMEREMLAQMVDNAVAHGQHTFSRNILQINVQENTLKIMGYAYQGYVRRINNTQAYFNFNMDLLQEHIRQELFFGGGPVYTKIKDEVPAKYTKDAKASNSLLADGCIIEGTVENSVLFRGVRIGKGAVVRNSIIMQDAEVQEGAELEYAILDKQTLIKRGRRLIGPPSYPIVLEKNRVI